MYLRVETVKILPLEMWDRFTVSSQSALSPEAASQFCVDKHTETESERPDRGSIE